MPKTRLRSPLGKYSTFGNSIQVSTHEAATTPHTTMIRGNRPTWSVRLIPINSATIHSATRSATPKIMRIGSISRSTIPPTPERRSRCGFASVRMTFPSRSRLCFFKMRIAAVGTTATATSIERATAAEIEIAMSRNSCPASSRMKRTGINTARFASVALSSAPHTSPAPLTAAVSGSSPR